jgi:hypothetical protein
MAKNDRVPHHDNLSPNNKKAPPVTGEACWIRCFSTYDQRAKSSRAPPPGFLRMIVRVFIGRNMGSTLPYVSPPVKLGYDVFAVEVAAIAGRIP